MLLFASTSAGASPGGRCGCAADAALVHALPTSPAHCLLPFLTPNPPPPPCFYSAPHLPSDFDYRQCWGSDSEGHNFDKTQVFNNTIYVQPQYNATVACNRKNIPLDQFQKDGSDPGSRQISGMPSTPEVVAHARAILGSW